MSKRTTSSELVAAAQAFDDELAGYARAGDLFLKGAFNTVKQVERAAELVGEIAAAEDRIAAAGQRLVAALNAARGAQEAMAAEVVARVPAWTERREQLGALLGELEGIATETAALNAASAEHPDPARLAAMLSQLDALAGRAEALAGNARAAGFDDLATQAHALHQRLRAVTQKIDRGALPPPS